MCKRWQHRWQHRWQRKRKCGNEHDQESGLAQSLPAFHCFPDFMEFSNHENFRLLRAIAASRNLGNCAHLDRRDARVGWARWVRGDPTAKSNPAWWFLLPAQCASPRLLSICSPSCSQLPPLQAVSHTTHTHTALTELTVMHRL